MAKPGTKENTTKDLLDLINFFESEALIKLNLIAGTLSGKKVAPPGSDIPYEVLSEELYTEEKGKDKPLLFLLRSKEMKFLEKFPDSVERLYQARPAGIVVSFFTGAKYQNIFRSLVKKSKQTGIPLLSTRADENKLFARLTVFSLEFFSPAEKLHANLLDVYGIGVLIRGESGIGKSECSLELLKKGHRLVADDIVEIRRRIDGTLIGMSPYPYRHHLEIRGIGIINVHTVFGVGAVRERKRVDLVVDLITEEEYQGKKENSTIRDSFLEGVFNEKISILDIELPRIEIPTKPGRSVSSLVEIAALQLRASQLGFSAARELDNLLIKMLQTKHQNRLTEESR